MLFSFFDFAFLMKQASEVAPPLRFEPLIPLTAMGTANKNVIFPLSSKRRRMGCMVKILPSSAELKVIRANPSSEQAHLRQQEACEAD